MTKGKSWAGAEGQAGAFARAIVRAAMLLALIGPTSALAADITAPHVTALSFPANVDVSSGPATVTVNYTASDDQAGMYFFEAYFQPPGGGCGVGNYQISTGLTVNGSISFQLGQFNSTPGTYRICLLRVQDRARHARFYTPSDLQGFGFPTSFTVTGTRDTTLPLLTALSFPASVDVSNGPATVTVNYGATDDLGGVTFFEISFQNPAGICALNTFQPSSGLAVSGSPSFQVGRYTTAPGVYTVCQLRVYDAASNRHDYSVADLQTLGLPTQFTVLGTQDTTAPQLTALSFPASVDLSNSPATVTVDYSASDDLSGVAAFEIYFQVPGGSCGINTHHMTSGLAVSGSPTFQLGQFDTPAGTYTICQLRLRDSVGNLRNYSAANLQGLGLPTQFTVTASHDVTAPLLTALSFPASVDIGSGAATVSVDYSAADDLSGVAHFEIAFQPPGGACTVATQANTSGLTVSGNPAFQITPPAAALGVYSLCHLRLRDAVGNTRDYSADDLQTLGLPTQFTVTGTADTTAPQLTALSFPAAVNLANGPATVSVDYTAGDDFSGVAAFEIYFQIPGGGCGLKAQQSTSGLLVSGSPSFQLSQFTTPIGPYTVCKVRLQDKAGNPREYSATDLQGLGFPSLLTVSGAQDVTAPQLSGLSFASSFDIGQGPAIATIHYAATDDLSGVAFFAVYFQVAGGDCGTAAYSAASGLTVSGDPTIQLDQYNTPIGTYTVCELRLQDTAGNLRIYSAGELQGLGFPNAFTVIGTQDLAAPTLSALSFAPSIDVSHGPATMAFNYSAADDLSGMYYFEIFFQVPGGGCSLGTYQFSNGQAVSGAPTLLLAQNGTRSGTYVLCQLRLQDAVHHSRYYSVGDLQGLGFPTQFEVVNTAGVCGNGTLEGAEECDDGNTNAADGCNASCRFAPFPTPTQTAPPTPTATASATPTTGSSVLVTGAIRYFRGDQPIANVDLTTAGPNLISGHTNVFGSYSLGLPAEGTQSVVASKHGDRRSAITAFDAVRALRASSGLEPVSGDQLLACDSNGSGSLTAFDASAILQLQVGLIQQLPVAIRCDSDWLFRPLVTSSGNITATAAVLSPGCQLASLNYTGLSDNVEGQDYSGILLGDCNGSWQPPSGGGAALSSDQPVHVTRGHLKRGRDGSLRLPLFVDGPASALEIVVRYDPAQLSATRVVRSGPWRAALYAVNLQEAGVARIAMANSEAIEATERPPVTLHFVTLGTGRPDDPLVETSPE